MSKNFFKFFGVEAVSALVSLGSVNSGEKLRSFISLKITFPYFRGEDREKNLDLLPLACALTKN